MDPVVETTPSTSAIEFLAWVEVNKKRLIVGASIAIGIAAIAACYNYYADQREITASEALTGLRGPIPGVSKAPPATGAQFLKLADDYSGTSAASQALLLGADALYAEGKYAEAQVAFEQFIQKNGTDPLVSHASLGIAASLDAAGKTAEALTKYQEVGRQNATDMSVSSLARLSAARILESQGKLAEAHKAYRDLSDMSRGQMYNSWMEEAMNRAGQLEKAHPELVPPPPPMPVTPPAPVVTAPSAAPTAPKLLLTTNAAPKAAPTGGKK